MPVPFLKDENRLLVMPYLGGKSLGCPKWRRDVFEAEAEYRLLRVVRIEGEAIPEPVICHTAHEPDLRVSFTPSFPNDCNTVQWRAEPEESAQIEGNNITFLRFGAVTLTASHPEIDDQVYQYDVIERPVLAILRENDIPQGNRVGEPRWIQIRHDSNAELEFTGIRFETEDGTRIPDNHCRVITQGPIRVGGAGPTPLQVQVDLPLSTVYVRGSLSEPDGGRTVADVEERLRLDFDIPRITIKMELNHDEIAYIQSRVGESKLRCSFDLSQSPIARQIGFLLEQDDQYYPRNEVGRLLRGCLIELNIILDGGTIVPVEVKAINEFSQAGDNADFFTEVRNKLAQERSLSMIVRNLLTKHPHIDSFQLQFRLLLQVEDELSVPLIEGTSEVSIKKPRPPYLGYDDAKAGAMWVDIISLSTDELKENYPGEYLNACADTPDNDQELIRRALFRMVGRRPGRPATDDTLGMTVVELFGEDFEGEPWRNCEERAQMFFEVRRREEYDLTILNCKGKKLGYNQCWKAWVALGQSALPRYVELGSEDRAVSVAPRALLRVGALAPTAVWTHIDGQKNNWPLAFKPDDSGLFVFVETRNQDYCDEIRSDFDDESDGEREIIHPLSKDAFWLAQQDQRGGLLVTPAEQGIYYLNVDENLFEIEVVNDS